MDDIELLPLPPLWIVPSVEPADYPDVAQALMDYARANVAHATAPLQAEIEALRAIIDNREAIIATHAADTREYQKQLMHAQARAERLETALQMIAGTVPCPDSLMGNVDIAIAALREYDQEKNGND